jgi:type I restriction enzyme S subunit
MGSEIGSIKQVVEPGDVLISRIVPHIQRVWVVPKSNGHRQIASGEWIIFRGDDVQPQFLRHMLMAKPFHEKFMQTVAGVGGSLLRARPKEVERIEIPVPSDKDEQCRIAAILDKADDIRRKREQALALADDLLKSAFLAMFGDLERNDKNWPTEPLGNLLSVSPQNGIYKPSSDYGAGVRILRIDGFYDGYLEDEATFKRLSITGAESQKYALNNGDVVINRVNSRKYLGKSALIEGFTEPTVFESNMMRFAVKRDELVPRFLVDQLQTEYIKRQILTCSKDAVNQSSINQRDVEAFRIRVPPVEFQRTYGALVRKAQVSRRTQLEAIAEAGRLFAALSQRAFRGEL